MDEKEDKDRSVSPLPDKKNNGKPFKTMKSRVLSGAFWLFMEKGGLGFVEFAVAWGACALFSVSLGLLYGRSDFDFYQFFKYFRAGRL